MASLLKSKLRDGGVSIGSWLQLNSPDVAEIMARAGFEWLVVDMEHGAIEVADLPNLFRAIENGGSIPLARLSENDPYLIKRVLDAGAAGIIVPMIRSGEECRQAIRATRYPPGGVRGIGFARANAYGADFERAFAAANDDVVVVAQIEHIDAVRDIDAIFAARPDAFLIGPYDLSGSMNKTGQFSDPEVEQACRDALAAGKRHGIPAGIHVIAPDGMEVARRVGEGYCFIAASLDTTMLSTVAGNLAKEVQK